MFRRRSLRIAAACILALIAFTAVGCGGDDDSGSGGGDLVFVSAGGSYGAAYNAAYLRPFAESSGVEIHQGEGADDPISAVRAQVETGNVQWDVVNCLPSFVVTDPEIWEPIDRKIVKSTGDLVYPQVVTDRSVGGDVEAFPMFAYRNDAYKGQKPASWADFFDTKRFPGPRAIPNLGLESATGMPAVALLADGVAPDDLIPFDLDRAYRKLDELRPDIRVFWTTFVQSSDVLRLGEVDMTITSDGRAGQLVADGNEITPVFDQALRSTGGLCVPKGSANKTNAFKLLEYILAHPEQQGTFTSLTFYGPVTNAGVTAARRLGVKDFSSLHAKQLVPADSEKFLRYYQKNSDELLKRWNEWVGG